MTDAEPTDRELEALKILWERGKATVREIHQAMTSRSVEGEELAYTTVLSLLQTMERKGLTAHEASGKAYAYYAKVPKERAFGQLAASFLDRVFDGALGEYVARALQSRQPSLAELEELERLIADAKRQATNGKTKKSRKKTD